jgi:hypothetical protein
MQTLQTTDLNEVRRCRIAQFSGTSRALKVGDISVTGFVRSVREVKVRPHSDLDHHGSATQSHGIGGGLIEPHLSLIAAGGRFPIRTHFDGKK